MTNRKQTEGQDYCICGHKEFHHKTLTHLKKDVCCISGCECEHFNKKVKIIHDDNWNGHYSCSPQGKFNRKEASILQETVTCLKCLKLIKIEWESQSKKFKGQPRLNAIEGIKRTIKQIQEIKSEKKNNDGN